MPRTISSTHRAALEASHGADQPLAFLEFTHADLATPIRVVNDTGTENGLPVNWEYEGANYIAFPFELEVLTDDDNAPRAQLEIGNVDQAIGEAVRALASPVTLTLTLISPTEFDTSVNPRVPLASPVTVIYRAAELKLRNVAVDAMTVKGELGSLDDVAEPWPALRATKALFPGLYR